MPEQASRTVLCCEGYVAVRSELAKQLAQTRRIDRNGNGDRLGIEYQALDATDALHHSGPCSGSKSK